MEQNYILKKINIPVFVKKTIRKTIAPINEVYREKQIVMFHIGRCGSTVLAKMLNNHSNIFWGGEQFNNPKINSHNNVSVRERIKTSIDYSSNRRMSKIYGFETKYLPLQVLSPGNLNLQFNEYVEILKDFGFSKFVLLHRRNYLRRIISIEIGRQTKKWHIKKKPKIPQKVFLDINKVITGDELTSLLELFKIIDDSYEQALNCLQKTNFLKLVYEEDILPDPVIAYRKVCKFLEIPEESKKVELRKTNPFEVKEMLENFDAVERELKNTKYEWMLYS